MALRNSKIASEIITNCNVVHRLLASSPKLPASATLNFEPAQETIRYKISNTQRPRNLPEISFQNDNPAFPELQPSSQVEYQASFGNRESDGGATQVSMESPFPDHLGHTYLPSVKVSDRQKAEDKMLRAKAMSFQPINRKFSMTTAVAYAKQKKDDCGNNNPCEAKIKRCPEKKKKECRVDDDCPKHRLGNCDQSKGSNCKLNYLSPDCSKTNAPYPSYSELCAEELPEDPSECTQCPWRSCEDADTIRPQKKRHYSTRAYSTDVVVAPLSKPPCKPPPSPCVVRKEIEQKQKKEKEEKPKQKKGHEIHQVPILDRQVGHGESMYINSVYNALTGSTKLPETTWNYLENQTEVMEAAKDDRNRNKSQSGHCKIDIKPTKDKKPQTSEIIDYGAPEWWKGQTKRKFIEREDDYGSHMELDSKGKKKRGDEGHPPPCPPAKPFPGFNEPCPKVPLKYPKYKKRPLREPAYEHEKKDKESGY